MLSAFGGLPRDRVAVEVVEGTWPETADRVGSVDVAVSAHVVYNVADLAGFVVALDGRARDRVVLEFTTTSPSSAVWAMEAFLEPRPAVDPDRRRRAGGGG